MKAKRKEKYPVEWNLKKLFVDTPANIKKERARTKKAYESFIKKWKNNKKYLKTPAVLKKALEEYQKLSADYIPNELTYLHLLSEKKADDPVVKARENKAEEFYQPIFNEMEFFMLNISKIPKKDQPKFLKNSELEKFRHFLKGLFDGAEHLLSEPEEKIMNLKSSTSYGNWVRMTESFISKEEVVVLNSEGKKEKMPVTKANSLIFNKNKKIRKTAAEAIYGVLNKHADVAESEINSILQDKRINDRLRKYKRPEQARHLGDDMDSKTVDLIVDRVSKYFKISRDFYTFRAKITNLKKLNYYERVITIDNKSSKEYSYEEAVGIVNRSLLNLDEEFSNIFMSFVESGQIDVYPKKGKTGGAFCSYGHKNQPVHILLNHNNKLRDVLTIAHEVGHGINAELVKKHQEILNSGISLAIAEVASTFMEDFALKEASKDLDDESRFVVLINKLDDSIASIFRQVAAYMFEQDLHKRAGEKGYLPKEEIGEIFKKHMANYLGKDVIMNEGSENSWVSWSHFRNFFYVYSYASGLLISKYLQSEVSKNPEFIKKVKKFLSSGSISSPKDILKEVGIDINKAKFWDEGLKEIEGELVEAKKLARKLGKI